MDDERRGPPELGTEEARERIRRSGVPLDSWEPVTRDAVRGEIRRQRREGIMWGAAVAIGGLVVVIALALTSGSDVREPVPCAAADPPCLRADGQVDWRFADGVRPVSREQYEDWMRGRGN